MAKDKGGEAPPKTDVEAHERTFRGFVQVAALTAAVTFAILIFLAIVGT